MSAVADSDAPNVASPPARVSTVIGPLPCRAGEREPRCAHSPMRPRRCRYLEQRQRVPRRRACEQGGLSRDAPQKEAPCTRVCRVAQKRASRDTRSQFRIIWWPNLQIPSTRLQPMRSGVGASCIPARAFLRSPACASCLWVCHEGASEAEYSSLVSCGTGRLRDDAIWFSGRVSEWRMQRRRLVAGLTRVRRTRRNGIK